MFVLPVPHNISSAFGHLRWPCLGCSQLQRMLLKKLSSRCRRDDMPPTGDSLTRGGSTSVRGRVHSPNVDKLQAASVPIAEVSCALRVGTDGRIAVSLNASQRRGIVISSSAPAPCRTLLRIWLCVSLRSLTGTLNSGLNYQLLVFYSYRSPCSRLGSSPLQGC